LTNTFNDNDNSNDVTAQTTSDGAENSTNNSNNFCPSNVLAQTNSSNGAANSTNVHVGRPKGSAIESNHDLKRRIELATEEAAEMYSHKKKQARASQSRVKKGKLTAIIQLCKANNSIPEKKMKFIVNAFGHGQREESLKESLVETRPQ
jgi:hypothetical protein